MTTKTVGEYTKGPWTLIRTIGGYAGNFEIAEALSEHHEANARLIAACPELLEAAERCGAQIQNTLEILLEYAEGDKWARDVGEQAKDALYQLQAAIAKARA